MNIEKQSQGLDLAEANAIKLDEATLVLNQVYNYIKNRPDETANKVGDIIHSVLFK